MFPSHLLVSEFAHTGFYLASFVIEANGGHLPLFHVGREVCDPATHAGTWLHSAVRHVPVSAFSYFKGLHPIYNHNHTGHAAYLMGQYSLFGWWFYFPVAFPVKSTVAIGCTLYVT
jgi:hypothetical protein